MPRLLWWGGLVALAVGAVLCVLGWYGVSGERFAERQLPYLASGTVPGAALVVAGAVWAAAGVRGVAGGAAGGEGPSEEPGGGAFRPSSQEPPVRVPDGTLAHRPDCPLVAGRPGVVPVGEAALAPCPVCEPGGGGGDEAGPEGPSGLGGGGEPGGPAAGAGAGRS
ncbi:hypothetical protein [Streptomyces thermolilacinus]|uniref:hypothetical protein n=1 Tax=Streptomyces thermolilacinus TaxID=285540 RepID=UPI0033E33272